MYEFTYFPDSTYFNNKENVICTFTGGWGISTFKDGSKITLHLIPQKTDALNTFADKKNQLSKKKHGFYYRLPAYTNVVLMLDKNVLCDEVIMIPQLGKVASLPLKKTRSRIAFTGEGALKRVEVK